jgi:hypothetical protein
MPLACKICPAMCGNVAPTVMDLILQAPKPIQLALQQVRTALFVAAAGASKLIIAVQPVATSTTRKTTASTLSGFACLSPHSSMTPPDSGNNEPTCFQYLIIKGRIQLPESIVSSILSNTTLFSLLIQNISVIR